MSKIVDFSNALIEWESGGLEDIATETILEFKEVIEAELKKREGTDAIPKL